MRGVVNCLTSQEKNPEIDNSHQHYKILDVYDTNRKNILCLAAIQAAYWIFSYDRAHAWCDYLSHLPDKNPKINSHHKILDIYPRKDIVSSCNFRCLLIFPYDRARAWCGYLSHLLEKKTPEINSHQQAAP